MYRLKAKGLSFAISFFLPLFYFFADTHMPLSLSLVECVCVDSIFLLWNPTVPRLPSYFFLLYLKLDIYSLDLRRTKNFVD